jgi:hypothetical protein
MVRMREAYAAYRTVVSVESSLLRTFDQHMHVDFMGLM